MLNDIREYRWSITRSGNGLEKRYRRRLHGAVWTLSLIHIFYRILAEQCGDFLNQGGSVYFETGHDQGAAVKTLLESHGFQDTKVIKDLAGMDRVVRGTWPGQIRK